MPATGRTTTDGALRDWEGGDTRAERLAAAILKLDGYEDIDPQHPMGGPDGGRDIVCFKGGRKYVAAVYFPKGQKSFAQIRRKFENDLDGVIKAGAQGIAFVTNQKLSQAQRKALAKIAGKSGVVCEPIHRERMRVHLDAPAGYGIRLDFLRIEMTTEEQFAYFAEAGGRVEQALERHSNEIRRLARYVEEMAQGQRDMERTISGLIENAKPGIASELLAQTPNLFTGDSQAEPVSSNLSVGLVLAIHRLACTDMPAPMVGRLRSIDVWVGSPNTTMENAQFRHPSTKEVRGALEELLGKWNANYPELIAGTETAKLEAVAKFHADFESIHPFVDGNGRAGRALLIQQCIDLLGQVDAGLLERGVAYQEAVRSAIEGDLEPLVEIIKKAVQD